MNRTISNFRCTDCVVLASFPPNLFAAIPRFVTGRIRHCERTVRAFNALQKIRRMLIEESHGSRVCASIPTCRETTHPFNQYIAFRFYLKKQCKFLHHYIGIHSLLSVRSNRII